MPNETQYLTIDEFFSHLTGEAISKKTKMGDGFTLKFALPIGGSLEGIPVFKTNEDLASHIAKNLSNTQYTVYGIKDGKITQTK